MRLVGSTDEYLRGEPSSYVAGTSWISWCHDQRLSGALLWGRTEEEDVRALLETTPLQGPSPLAVGRARLVDLRQLDVPPPSVFTVLHGYVTSHRDAAPAAVTHLALVRPPGMVGAIVVGFAHMVGTKFPMRVFTHPMEALEWMELADCASVLDEVERLQGEMAGSAEVVRQVRAALDGGSLAAATLGTVAREMGVSTRSLQRRLRESGTSFQREIMAARVRSAQRMLSESPVTVAEVAYAVGYSSVQQFASAFRKVTGASPRQWRGDRRLAAVITRPSTRR